MASPCNPCSTSGQSGFTLLELLIVLTVIGGLSVVGLNYLHLPKGGSALTSAQEMTSAMIAARSSAFISNQPTVFSLDLKSGRFEAPGSKEGFVPNGVVVTFEPAAGQSSGAMGLITFFPTGGATGGHLVLTGPAQQHSEITVDWLTGAISHAP